MLSSGLKKMLSFRKGMLYYLDGTCTCYHLGKEMLSSGGKDVIILDYMCYHFGYWEVPTYTDILSFRKVGLTAGEHCYHGVVMFCPCLLCPSDNFETCLVLLMC